MIRIPKSYDVVGSILIFQDFPDDLLSHEKEVAKKALSTYKNVTTVLRKVGEYGGRFRTPKLKYLAGRRTKVTLHKENGVYLRLDVGKVYFSSRLSHERKRVASLVQPNENVLVLFSGCGPYPLSIFSYQPHVGKVVSVELNPVAVRYQLENFRLNKFLARRFSSNNKKLGGKDLENAFSEKYIILQKDARKLNLGEGFDRIVMPLPRSAADFLPAALRHAHKGTIFHFYDFSSKDEFPQQSLEKIRNHIKNFRAVQTVLCGQYAPRRWRVCIDFKLL